MYLERRDTIAIFFFLINQNQQKILFEQGHIIATFWESTNLVKKTFWAHWLAFNLSKKNEFRT